MGQALSRMPQSLLLPPASLQPNTQACVVCCRQQLSGDTCMRTWAQTESRVKKSSDESSFPAMYYPCRRRMPLLHSRLGVDKQPFPLSSDYPDSVCQPLNGNNITCSPKPRGHKKAQRSPCTWQ